MSAIARVTWRAWSTVARWLERAAPAARRLTDTKKLGRNWILPREGGNGGRRRDGRPSVA